ncbi:MAG: tetratricopeptide repeat protein [Deltaproteobacteria bacterium]|nr:tetratricopeptide repeat protein [Deltaproteobacteria bacterium]
MSYQFSIDRTSPAKVSALVVIAMVFIVVAGYVLAACGDRTPKPASAGEPVVSTPAADPVAGPAETSTLIIAGPVSFGLADSAYRDRRYDDAVTLFEVYTEEHSTNPWGFYMLGLSAWKSGEGEQAEIAFGRALALDSNHVKSHINLSRVLLEGAKPESALVHIETAITLDSTSSEPLRLLGRAYEGLGRTDEAIAAYHRAIGRNDGDVWALNNLGALYIKLDRFEDAIGPLARALELEDGVATFYNNLGMALELTGRFSAASEAYRAALAIEGTYGKAVANLARVEQVKEDPSVPPVDLSERSRQFQQTPR